MCSVSSPPHRVSEINKTFLNPQASREFSAPTTSTDVDEDGAAFSNPISRLNPGNLSVLFRGAAIMMESSVEISKGFESREWEYSVLGTGNFDIFAMENAE